MEVDRHWEMGENITAAQYRTWKINIEPSPTEITQTISSVVKLNESMRMLCIGTAKVGVYKYTKHWSLHRGRKVV